MLLQHVLAGRPATLSPTISKGQTWRARSPGFRLCPTSDGPASGECLLAAWLGEGLSTHFGLGERLGNISSFFGWGGVKEVDHPCHTSCSKTLLGRDLQISLLFHWKCLASSLTGTPSPCTAEVYLQVFGLPRFFFF